MKFKVSTRSIKLSNLTFIALISLADASPLKLSLNFLILFKRK